MEKTKSGLFHKHKIPQFKQASVALDKLSGPVTVIGSDPEIQRMAPGDILHHRANHTVIRADLAHADLRGAIHNDVQLAVTSKTVYPCRKFHGLAGVIVAEIKIFVTNLAAFRNSGNNALKGVLFRHHCVALQHTGQFCRCDLVR